jgi:MFS family permease
VDRRDHILFGSEISAMALPLTIAFAFKGNAMQMGLLNASQLLPNLLITLLAGVLVDRVRRRQFMIGANIGRAVLLGFIPLSWSLGMLQIEHLYVLTFLIGVLTVIFDLAYQSYVPSLVNQGELVDANSKLQISASVAQVGGPGLAGPLISAVTAPVAVLFDAVSFLVSALSLVTIRRSEPKPVASSERRPLLRDIAGGFHIVWGNPYLRALASEAATFNLFNQVTWAVLVLYMTRDLQIGPSLMGITMSAASVGTLLGSVLAGYVGHRFGVGRAIVGSMLLACGSPLLIPLAGASQRVAVPLLVVAFFLGGAGVVVSNVHIVSLRQTITPQHLLGRMTASYRFTVISAAPVGSLLGGMLGSAIGLRPTLATGALGTFLAMGWVLFSPVPKLRHPSDFLRDAQAANG